jgi:hypothetical protein
MLLQAVARAPLDLGGKAARPRIGELRRPSADDAHDVVVMVGGTARDIGVRSVGEIDAFEDAEPLEQLERAEDGGPADRRSRPGLDELRGREGPPAPRDHRGDERAWSRQSLAGDFQDGARVESLLHGDGSYRHVRPSLNCRTAVFVKRRNRASLAASSNALR